MKKISLFFLLFACVFTLNTFARKIVVNTTATLQTAFNGAQDKDTISIKPGVYNVGTALKVPPTGLIVLNSFYKDTLAVVQMEMQAAADVVDGTYPKRTSLIFDNLHLQGRYGSFSSGNGYLFSLSGRYFSMDTLAFRNCEISKVSRCVLRSAPPTGKTSSGEMEWLEMSNCKVHEMNSKDHIWPVLYSAHIPMYVHIRNNTFYDMPYVKSIYQLAKITNVTGRSAEINFENNTVAVTYGRVDGVITTSNYLSEEASFKINNNMFIIPNWSDEYNLSRDSASYTIPPIVKCIGGIITASNNIVDSMRPWIAGQTLDLEGQGGFLVIDTLNNYKMKDLDFAWTDFADPKGNDFSYLSTKRPATSGTNGGIIGDPRWVKRLTNPRMFTASANIASAVITPRSAYYEDGASVTVKASVVDGYTFVGWKKVSDGTLLSTDNPYTFNITSDTEIIAEYKVLQPRNVTITINGSNSASFSIVPKKTIYYEGDVITLSVNNHYLNDFLGWNDGNKDMTRSVTIGTEDINLIADFKEHPYILAWDFHQLTANNQTFTNLASNHFTNTANKGVMNYVSLDTIRTVSTRNNKFIGEGKELAYCLTRRTTLANFGNPDYMFIKFSTKGLSNLKVKSNIATDNAIFKVQKLQYSLDGKVYTDFAVDTLSGNIDAIWRNFEGKLPVAAENLDSVYVRWIPDSSSERLFVTGLTASDFEYCYISKIIVIDSNFSAVKDLSVKDMYKVFAVNDKLMIQTERTAKAEIFTLMGQKIREEMIYEGRNEFAGFRSGIYLVRIGNEVHKVLVK